MPDNPLPAFRPENESGPSSDAEHRAAPFPGFFIPLLIFGLGLGLRLIYIFQIKDNPTFYNLILDCLSYDKWAREIAAGKWLGNGVFYQDPLYPYFLALLYRIFGRDLLLVRIIQAVIGSMSCVLIYFIGREVYGKQAGVLAGFFAAVYGVFIYYDGMANKPFLGVFLFNLALLSFIIGAKKKRGGILFMAGIFLGLSVLERANILLLVPLFWVWILMPHSIGRKSLLHCLNFLGGVLLAISPATIHNYIVSHEFVLTTSQAGQNFYIGNYPGNNTGTYLPPLFLRADPEFEEADFKDQAEFLKGKKLTPTEVSSFWAQKTLEIIKSDPGRFIENLFFKAMLFLNKYEIPDNHSYSFFKAYYSGLLRWDPFDFRLAGSLGLAGLLLSFFRVKGNHFSRFFPLICLFYLCSIIPFYIFSRYRLPVVSIMIIMSAFFMVFVVEKFRAGNFRETAFAIAAFLVSFALVNANIKKDDFSPQFGNIAHTFLEQGNHEEALKYYKKAVEANPGFAEPYYFIGKLFVDSGDLKQAEEYFRKSIEIEPGLFVGHAGLGIVSAQLGKRKEAEYFLKKAVELKPYSPEAHNNLGMIHAMGGDLESAKMEFQKALSIDPGFVQASQNLERLKSAPSAN